MTYNEFKRWLEKRDCTFAPGKGSHHKVYRGDRLSVLPMHGKKEIKKGLMERIKRDLGLK